MRARVPGAAQRLWRMMLNASRGGFQCFWIKWNATMGGLGIQFLVRHFDERREPEIVGQSFERKCAQRGWTEVKVII